MTLLWEPVANGIDPCMSLQANSSYYLSVSSLSSSNLISAALKNGVRATCGWRMYASHPSVKTSITPCFHHKYDIQEETRYEESFLI